MKKTIVLALGSMLIGSISPNFVSAGTSPTPVVSGGYGFYPLTSSNIPSAVKAVAGSVFKIVTPAAPLVTVRSIFGDGPIAAIISKVENTPAQQGLNQGDKDIYLFQLRACAKQQNPLNCKMFQQDAQSSAYVVGNGSRLRTAFHAVSSEVNASASLVGVEVGHGIRAAAPIQILVYDSSEKLIFSGSANAIFDSFNVNFGPDVGTTAPPFEDLVEIEFNKFIGKPLIPAKSISVGDAIYIIGYPAKTEGRPAKNAPDATGNDLTVSMGHVLGLDAVAARLGSGNASNLDSSTRGQLQKVTITDADGTVGLSGGAMVTEKGDVIGTYTSGNPADGSISENRLSFGSNDTIAGFQFTSK